MHQLGSHRMAHNLALSCTNGVLYAYGGTDARSQNAQWKGAHDGVYRARVMPDGSLRDPERMLEGRHDGCVERRDGFEGRCEFDGKLSVVEVRGGGRSSSPGRTRWSGTEEGMSK